VAVEPIAVGPFLTQIFQTKRIKEVIQEWTADPEQLQEIVEKELIEMGVFMIHPTGYHEFMCDQVVFLLRNSPNIRILLSRLAVEAKKRDENKRR
jgi:hypothetical protein